MGYKRSSGENIEKYLGLNLKMLSCMGLELTIDNSKAVDKRRILEKLPVFVTIALGTFAAISQVRLTVNSLSNNNILMATRACSHLFSNLLCISKGYQMAITVTTLEEILREINDIWKKNLSKDIFQEKIVYGATATLRFCKAFVIITLSTICSFGVPPIFKFLIQHLVRRSSNETYDYSQRILMIDYPFTINDSVTYCLILLEELMLLLGSGLYWVCCDTLFAQLTTHISLQFEILQYDIETLINRESIGYRLKRNFVCFVKRHRKLLSICELIRNVFNPVILITVLLSGMNLCMNIFELNKTISEQKYTEAPLHAFLFTNTFLEIVFYCTFAEKLTEQISSVSNSVYNCMWTEKDFKFRMFLQMIVIKSQRPFNFTAYGLFPLGHERLTLVIKAAFSYYMMLETIKYR